LSLGAHDFILKSESLIEELTLRIPIALAHAKARQLHRGDMAEAAALLPSPYISGNKMSYEKFMSLCEKSYLDLTIQFNEGKLSETANILGLSRSTLWKKLGDLKMKGTVQ
jgi:DNA-binding NtrC family response regulator